MAKRPRKPTNRKPAVHTCWHEAGHAVAGLVQGLAVHEVTVLPNGDSNGSCASPSLLMYHVTGARERRAIARKCIIAIYAGIEAERLVDPDAPEWHADEDRYNALQTSRDYVLLPRRCAYVGDDLHLAFLNRLRGEARRLVRRHESQIGQLAGALAERLTLKGADAAKVIGLSRQRQT